MKICIIGPAHPFRGGIALFSERLAQQFLEEGHHVEIITFTLQYPNFLFPGKTQFSENEPTNNLTIHRKINSINPFNWIKTGLKIKRKEYNIVIFNYWMPFMAPCFGTLAYFIKKNKNTTQIGLLHNVIPHEKRIGDKILTNYFLTKMTAFLVLSSQVKNELQTFTKTKKIALSPHPLYDNFGAEISKKQAISNLKLDATFNYILFFGIIREYKGLMLLLNAFADKRIDKTNVKLIIAGEFYEDETPYLTLIEKLDIKQNVVLVNNFIPNNEVVNYFCAADIIAQPYISATQSGVTQIAYHFNKPMLVTNVGGLGELVPDQKVGYVVQPNANHVADALVDFFNNNRASEFIEGVKTEKLKYSWKKLTTSLLLLIK